MKDLLSNICPDCKGVINTSRPCHNCKNKGVVADAEPEIPMGFVETIRDVMYDILRNTEPILYFIEFPDGSWLMEDRLNKTRDALFALPIKDKKMAELFVKHYELDKELGCKVTEHKFVR